MSEEMVRLSVDIPATLHQEYKALLPWGLQRHLVQAVIRLIVEALRKDGLVVAGAIIEGRFKIVQVETSDAPPR